MQFHNSEHMIPYEKSIISYPLTHQDLIIEPLHIYSGLYQQQYLLHLLKNTLIMPKQMQKPKFPDESNPLHSLIHAETILKQASQNKKVLEFMAPLLEMKKNEQQKLNELMQEELIQHFDYKEAKQPSLQHMELIEEKLVQLAPKFELKVVSYLCFALENPLLKESGANDIIYMLNNYATEKTKIDHAVKELNFIVQRQALMINQQLETKHHELREMNETIIKELNKYLPEPIVIQRVFQAIQGFLNVEIKDDTAKKDSQSTRNAILQDKKKHSKTPVLFPYPLEKAQQQQRIYEKQKKDNSNLPFMLSSPADNSNDKISRYDIKKLFINVLQTPQTYQLWLRTAETLVLISHFKANTEALLKKLNPILLSFLSIYKHVSEEQQSHSAQQV